MDNETTRIKKHIIMQNSFIEIVNVFDNTALSINTYWSNNFCIDPFLPLYNKPLLDDFIKPNRERDRY